MLNQFFNKRIVILVLIGLIVASVICGIVMYSVFKNADVDLGFIFQKTYVSNDAILKLNRDGTYVYEYIYSDAFFEGTYEYNKNNYTLYYSNGDVYEVFSINQEGDLVNDSLVFKRQ